MLNGKRKEVEVALDTEAHRRNCTAVNLANNLSETLRITNLLRQERADFDKKNPFAPFIRQYILDQVADIVAKKFRLQPLKPPIPFKTDFSISTIKSPGNSPKVIYLFQ